MSFEARRTRYADANDRQLPAFPHDTAIAEARYVAGAGTVLAPLAARLGLPGGQWVALAFAGPTVWPDSELSFDRVWKSFRMLVAMGFGLTPEQARAKRAVDDMMDGSMPALDDWLSAVATSVSGVAQQAA